MLQEFLLKPFMENQLSKHSLETIQQTYQAFLSPQSEALVRAILIQWP